MNDNNFDYMDIYSQPGDKVICAFPHAGYPYDQEKLLKHRIAVGDVVTVEKTEIHGWSTDLYLKEYPGVRFNTVNFGVKKG